MIRLDLAALALSAALMAGCAPDSRPPVFSTETLKQGRAVYNFRCYFCHGYSGNGKTLAATYMTPPPRDFTASTPGTLEYTRILSAVREGVAGTGMKPFKTVISDSEAAAVAAFVYDEFVVRKAPNTRYHTPENGWPEHDRYSSAFPFALGEIALNEPWDNLTADQQTGKTLFLNACISCHDRGKPTADTVNWDSRPLSYPRNNYDHRNPEVDAATSATPYRVHDRKPELNSPSPDVRRGEKLFQDNCAFCHAADGTGKNWIGAFLEPHPRNLTDPAFMKGIDRVHLRGVIRDGLPGTSMPAWKSVLADGEIDAVVQYIDAAFHPVAERAQR